MRNRSGTRRSTEPSETESRAVTEDHGGDQTQEAPFRPLGHEEPKHYERRCGEQCDANRQRGGRGDADTDGECECDDGQTDQHPGRGVGPPPPIRRATRRAVASPVASRERQGQVRNRDLVRQGRECRAHPGAPSCSRTVCRRSRCLCIVTSTYLEAP